MHYFYAKSAIQMVQVGKWNKLKVVKEVDFGLYLDGEENGEILLPKRYVPENAIADDELKVFIYHDNEHRLIATTQVPLGEVGEIIPGEVVTITPQGAFITWGIMKDLFVPLSQQISKMVKGGKYLVYIYIDEQTGRVAATERIHKYLDNEALTVKELEEVDITIWRRTDIGYPVIINSRHTGVLHFSDVFRDLEIGDRMKGFIKKIRPEGKIDVALGEHGYSRVEGEGEKILRLLNESNGYLPFHDKSAPEEIYETFGMSKKTFKMTIGALYKQGKIDLTKTGIKLIENT
jgi:predicted RNA-binding protein (virulence factor B family)